MVRTDLLVKIAFLLDCTGSMEPWIHAAKTKIHEILRSVRKEHRNAVFEVALVAYRDYGDEDRFKVVNFGHVDRFVSALDPIHAKGGDDAAEDIAGALHKAVYLSWDDAHVRMLVHLADAPAHGDTFHAAHVSDRFPGGDPDGHNPRELLRTLVQEHQVEYTFVRMTSATDRMVEVFREWYAHDGGQFRVIDLHPQTYSGEFGDPENGNMADVLSPALSRAVSQTITRYTSSQDK